jgi:chemotaxis signal transduction protein
MEMRRDGSDEPGVSAVYVHVCVGAETYALPVGDVQEVVPLGEPTPLPGAPRSLLGLVTVHGRVIAVFDLAAYLEAAGERSPKRVAVVSHGAARAGFAVDEVLGVGPLPTTAASDRPLLTAAGIGEDGRLVGVIDSVQLLASLA